VQSALVNGKNLLRQLFGSESAVSMAEAAKDFLGLLARVTGRKLV
jgi:hypothetical protein